MRTTIFTRRICTNSCRRFATVPRGTKWGALRSCRVDYSQWGALRSCRVDYSLHSALGYSTILGASDSQLYRGPQEAPRALE
eukprot:2085923-Pyramimonas_sp.AAC.1